MTTDPRRDIVDRADVEVLVQTFYNRALSDALLFDYFIELRFGELDHHLPKICDYWDTRLFHTDRYREDSLQVHLRLDALHPLRSAHFLRWIELWVATIDELFVGPVSTRAKFIGAQMVCVFNHRITGTYSRDLERVLLAVSWHVPVNDEQLEPDGADH